jgi:hypothetical protein
MELLLYIYFLGAAILLSINTKPLKPLYFKIFWFLSFFVLSLTVRLNLQGDMLVYQASMDYKSFSPYYIREPVVWLGMRIIYSLLDNTYLVFIVLDMIMGLVLWASLSNLKLPQYAFFSFIIFFPFILGMQNIYRQWFASILILYTYSIVLNSSQIRRPLVTFILASLSHNAAAVFLPLLVTASKKSKILIYTLALIISALGVVQGAGTKSNTTVGADLGAIYLALFVLIIMFFLLSDRLIIRRSRSTDYMTILTVVYLCVLGLFVLGGSGRERLALMALFIIYPLLIRKIETRFVNHLTLRILIIVFGFVPLLVFNTRYFILT